MPGSDSYLYCDSKRILPYGRLSRSLFRLVVAARGVVRYESWLGYSLPVLPARSGILVLAGRCQSAPLGVCPPVTASPPQASGWTCRWFFGVP